MKQTNGPIDKLGVGKPLPSFLRREKAKPRKAAKGKSLAAMIAAELERPAAKTKAGKPKSELGRMIAERMRGS